MVRVTAERAAGIEYEFVERPAGVQADFVLPGNATLRFLAMRALDGFRLEAALAEPSAQTPTSPSLIVSVHGSGGRYDASPNGFLVRLLAGQGFAALAINTRQSGARINTDNFFGVRRDIEAAVYTGRALGYRRVILHGHSLGTIQVQYYAANNWDPDLRAVVLTGMFANLPWKSRHMLVQDERRFAEFQEASLQALREGREADTLPMRMRRTRGEMEPVTG
jgi:pimeloyl-ACP methyl ester carboxylesterase